MSIDSPRRASPPLIAVALLSAAALGYEILLMRLFSIILWHHFAYMMISVALLGYGAAGTVVALFQRTLQAAYIHAFVAGAGLFGITAVAGFLLAQRVGFNPLEMLWDPAQSLRLLLLYGLLFIPFLCAALPICLTFMRFGEQPHRIYSFDIVGAGLGCLGILTALFVMTPLDALKLIGALGLLAAAVAAYTAGLRPRWIPAALLMAAAILPVSVPADWQRLRPSDYKDLTQALRIGGSRIVAERSSPLGLVTVVENAAIPLRHAPGLSLNAAMELPQQMGIFVDGDGPSALTHYDGRRDPLAYLDHLTSALPYHLLVQPRVLVLGAGAGADVLQALYHHAPAIDAVELDPQVIELVQRALSDFSGKPYGDPAVQVRIGEARGFVAKSSGRYDLIQVALLDAFGVASAGLHALSESYLYTVEALQEYLEHLEPGGMLAITRWVNVPPRDVLKLFATAVEALERRGASQPAQHLVLIRGWKTATLVVKNGAFTSADLRALKDFCRQRSFDVAYYPGIEPAETNRYNLLEQPFFHDGALAVLGRDRDTFFDRYKFAITPATDDRPYYFHFFKWRTLPELLRLKEQGGLPLLEWGYPVLVATLMQALAASLLLILLPLWILRRRSKIAGAVDVSSLRVGIYFLMIGFAFMFVEIAFIQKFVLFLSHPLYAIASVLCAFLIFAGVGSRFSRRLLSGKFAGRAGPVVWPAIAIGLLALTYAYVLPSVFRPLMALADGLKILLTLALIAPLAFAMGMPFPLGLASLAARAPPLIPWAWAINACASVIAAIVATLLAIHFGFTAVVLVAVLLYALSVAIYR